jgi:hypothetical protein
MASKHISELSEIGVLQETGDFIVEQGGITYRVTAGKVADYVNNKLPDLDPTPTLAGTDILTIAQEGGAIAVCTIEQVADYRRYGKLVNLGSVTGSVNLDLGLYDIFVMVAEGDIVVGLSNVPAHAPYQFMIRIKQGGAGNLKVTWASLLKHPNDEAAALSKAVGDIDIFIATSFEDGRIEMSKTGPFKS